MKKKKVRPLAICIFRKDDKIFVAEGYDPTRQEIFYRPIGGRIEFGEKGHDTLVREIREEIGAEITNLQYLGTIENIFTYDGQPGHEIVLIYDGAFVDKSLHEKTWIEGYDDGKLLFKAAWKPIADFQSGQAPLYPEGLLEMLIRQENVVTLDHKRSPSQPFNEKSQMIFDAIESAAKAHTGQFRKGTNVPYIIHPLAVAKILIDCGCSVEVVVAGILHDMVEDTPVTLEDIHQSFGEAVAQLVEGASEPEKSDTWENRKQHTIEYLKTAPINVLLVACADKLDNIKTIQEDYAKAGESVWARFNRPKEHQRWYYQALAEVFATRMQGEPTISLFQKFKSEVEKVFGKKN